MSRRGPLKVDLHVHTADDPFDVLPADPVETIERAAALGFDAIAITHHDSRFLPTPDVLEASERTGVLVLPGVERSLDGGCHVLVVGGGAEIDAVSTLDDLAAARRPEHLIVAPHPLYPGRQCLGEQRLLERLDLFDAIEWSHFWVDRWLEGPNRRAAEIARRAGKPLLGTGDIHFPEQMGWTYALVDAEREPASIVEAIRAGRVELATRPLPVLRAARIAVRLVRCGLEGRLRTRRSARFEPAVSASGCRPSG